MTPKILCVDDEPNVLRALVRTLSEEFEVDTAEGGEAALAKIASTSYAVIVSDMRMPNMSGATLLSTVRESNPLTVRVLLTGQTDMDSAIAAVNDGAIFRFLAKPCPPATLVKTIHAAAEQHRLLTAERELLDGTVQGIVRLLTDVLAAASPPVSARAGRLRGMVGHVADVLKIAVERRVALKAEILQLEEFVRMGESLLSSAQKATSGREGGGAQPIASGFRPVARPY